MGKRMDLSWYGKTDRIYYSPGVSIGRSGSRWGIYLATWRRWAAVSFSSRNAS